MSDNVVELSGQEERLRAKSQPITDELKNLAEASELRHELTLQGIEVEDIKDWWARKVLSDKAYIAIALKCEAMRTFRVTGRYPTEIDVDIDKFISDWDYDDGLKHHELSRQTVMASISALSKKHEFEVKTRQLSLAFLG